MSVIFDPKIKVKFYKLTVDEPNDIFDGMAIDDLYIDFDIMLTNNTSTNTANITVYNISAFNRELLTSTLFNVLEVYAGYDEDTSLIFCGTITSVRNELDGADWKSIIECKDGDYFLAFKKSYEAGTLYMTIIEDLCKASGRPYAIDKLAPPSSLNASDYKLRLGRTYYGAVRDLLTQVCKDAGMHWYIMNGVLEVGFKHMLFKPDKEGVLLAYWCGLIGTPTPIFRTIKEPKEVSVPNKMDKKKGEIGYLPYMTETQMQERQVLGIEIKAFLNPYVKPGRVVRVVSVSAGASRESADDGKISTVFMGGTEVNGTFKGKDYIVDTVNFYGNNYGGDFMMRILGDYPIGDDEQNVKLITVR